MNRMTFINPITSYEDELILWRSCEYSNIWHARYGCLIELFILVFVPEISKPTR